jgi:Domain of unknown function (DUF4062)
VHEIPIASRIFGQSVYEVSINEKAAEDGISRQAWDHCMEQARDCDVFIALFNGNAGWPDKAGTIGICHAEFEKAYTSAPGKVFVVNIHEPEAKGAPRGGIHTSFQEYIQRLRRFDTRATSSEADIMSGGLLAIGCRARAPATLAAMCRTNRQCNLED